jgi:S-adenosylmethionine-diacylglycerol 3-amino-3-carboxypropyl transferase
MLSQRSRKALVHRTHDYLFHKVHGSRLIYNACWEDPRIDRKLLGLDEKSKVVVITSAGCNALDYLLDNPAEIHAVDVNPRQNALLQLKLALIQRGDFENLFAMFGNGHHRAFGSVLESLWSYLPDYATRYWKAKRRYFNPHGLRKSFYYHGAAGEAALLLQTWMRSKVGLLRHLMDLFEARDLVEQKEIYRKIDSKLWGRFTKWLVSQPTLLTLMGVPRPQINLIARSHRDGVAGYIRDKLRHVLTEVLTADNYFWRVYLHGSYTKSCCPNYLKEENYPALMKNAERIRTYDTTLTRFLQQTPSEYTHFVLLDHQDWMAHHAPDKLEEEWTQILENSASGAKILMRSAGPDVGFLPRLAKQALRFFPQITEALHVNDRVGTYGATHLAMVR